MLIFLNLKKETSFSIVECNFPYLTTLIVLSGYNDMKMIQKANSAKKLQIIVDSNSNIIHKGEKSSNNTC